jgi:hypothetical protein
MDHADGTAGPAQAAFPPGSCPAAHPGDSWGHEVQPMSWLPANGQRPSRGAWSLTEIRTHPAEQETVTVNRDQACGTASAPVPP